MNTNERYYRCVMGSIGLSLLLFLLLIFICDTVTILFLSFLMQITKNIVLLEVASQLFYAAGYLLAFMIPALVLKRLIQEKSLPYRSMYASIRFSPWVFLILPAGVTMIFSAVTVNASLVNIIGYADFFNEVTTAVDATPYAPYQIVLQSITLAFVPGFCEEFLFRGAIQTNLLPFGRSNAIFISAFLFALMHQNVNQMFYAFAAGILLGVIYERTESIWACTALHVMNNLISEIESVLSLNVHSLAAVLLDCVLFFVGIVAIVLLVVRFFSKRTDFREGIFAKNLPASDGYALYPLAAERARSLFFTPTIILFLILSVLQL